QISLISPSNTISDLTKTAPDGNFSSLRLLSTNFMGENSQGTWQLKIVSDLPLEINNFNFKILGH
ncbi:MAG: hypothetical protein GXO62_05085, partial [Epsilonproteobacteria bacterium]|nr:hypothetical protein [Campylobacterota bacterium]